MSPDERTSSLCILKSRSLPATVAALLLSSSFSELCRSADADGLPSGGGGEDRLRKRTNERARGGEHTKQEERVATADAAGVSDCLTVSPELLPTDGGRTPPPSLPPPLRGKLDRRVGPPCDDDGDDRRRLSSPPPPSPRPPSS